MSEVRNLYINEKGELVLKKDLLESLHLLDNKVECIVDSDQIILRTPAFCYRRTLWMLGRRIKGRL